MMIAASSNLFVTTLLASNLSLFVALVFALLNAPDVALTEAAVGAGASSLLFLAVLVRTGNFYSYQRTRPFLAFLVASIFFVLMAFSMFGLPTYGSADAIANTHLARYYLDNTLADTGLPNAVTAILASYRGF